MIAWIPQFLSAGIAGKGRQSLHPDLVRLCPRSGPTVMTFTQAEAHLLVRPVLPNKSVILSTIELFWASS